MARNRKKKSQFKQLLNHISQKRDIWYENMVQRSFLISSIFFAYDQFSSLKTKTPRENYK